jgi:hypothetical protein
MEIFCSWFLTCFFEWKYREIVHQLQEFQKPYRFGKPAKIVKSSFIRVCFGLKFDNHRLYICVNSLCCTNLSVFWEKLNKWLLRVVYCWENWKGYSNFIHLPKPSNPLYLVNCKNTCTIESRVFTLMNIVSKPIMRRLKSK